MHINAIIKKINAGSPVAGILDHTVSIPFMLANMSADIFGILDAVKTKNDREMSEKAADAAIALFGLCGVAGIDIEKEILNRLGAG